MADDPSLHDPTEATEIDLNCANSIGFWSERLGIDETRLRDLVTRVGPKVQDIRRVLGEYSPTSTRR